MAPMYSLAGVGNSMVNSDSATNTQMHCAAVKPGASVGLMVQDLGGMMGTEVDARGMEFQRITPTTPAAQTPELYNTHEPACAATGMEDSAASGWTKTGNPIISVGASWTTTNTRLYRRGWTTPKALHGIMAAPGESTYLACVAHPVAGNSLVDTGSQVFRTHITFGEPRIDVFHNRSAYRRGYSARAGYYQSKSSRIGLDGVSAVGSHKGQFSFVPDHAYVQIEDWPDSFQRGSDLTLLLTAPTGQTVDVGQVQEDDTAQPITWAPKNRLVNQVVEEDTAQALTSLKTAPVAQVQENDTANAISSHKTAAVAQAVENDTAQPIAWAPKNRLVVQVQENDTAQTVTPVLGATIVPVDQVVENDTAQAVAWSPKNRLVEQVIEQDTAQTITPVLSSVPPAGGEGLIPFWRRRRRP